MDESLVTIRDSSFSAMPRCIEPFFRKWKTNVPYRVERLNIVATLNHSDELERRRANARTSGTFRRIHSFRLVQSLMQSVGSTTPAKWIHTGMVDLMPPIGQGESIGGDRLPFQLGD